MPIGCIAYGKARDVKFTDWGEIVSIYLLPDHFRKGYKNCYLWVLKENTPARSFYESNGFICNNDQCTCEIMQKQLVDVRYIFSIN